MAKKPHPLKGRKVAPETIAKRIATLAKKRAARAKKVMLPGEEQTSPKKRKYSKRKVTRLVVRTPEQLIRDIKEALWCIDQAVTTTRRKIVSGELSLTDVTDEETYLYMAKRYLEGGLKT